jgi:acyl-coenzyme A synthetase/AMP-(fatty) acid ligase
LALGYLKRPELTQEKFVDNPFRAGEVLYRTGDIVKYLPDGNIDFIRRADSQTKIRGFRIEPGEVEAALKGHPGVEEAAVVVREDKTGERKLVGYVVSRSDKIVKEWRAYLQEKLPSYMIPSTMVRLSALPLTPNGKIDRKNLNQLAATTAENREQYAPPANILEETLAKIW